MAGQGYSQVKYKTSTGLQEARDVGWESVSLKFHFELNLLPVRLRIFCGFKMIAN